MCSVELSCYSPRLEFFSGLKNERDRMLLKKLPRFFFTVIAPGLLIYNRAAFGWSLSNTVRNVDRAAEALRDAV